MTRLRKRFALLLCAVLALLLAGPSYADPPPWAPAHGYRAKHGHALYVLPVGLRAHYCQAALFDQSTAGGLIGAGLGALAGAHVGDGRGKLAATALGTLVGYVIGREVGAAFTHDDVTCFARTLEHAPDRHTIAWNQQDRVHYSVTPTATRERDGGYCREYTATARIGGETRTVYGTACRQPDGSWKLVS